MQAQTYSNRSNANRAGNKQFGAGNFDVAPHIAGGFVVVQFVAEPLPAWPFPKGEDFAQPVKASNRVLREERNGVKKPLKGVCADLWAAFDEVAAVAEAELTVADVRAYATLHNLNINNATLEFYAWRKFNA
jgi:hypothetical protein